jgi:hypothetical protein
MTADAGGSDATNALRESIERFDAKTARQTAWLLTQGGPAASEETKCVRGVVLT